MKFKIRDMKKIITVLFAVLICGSVFAQRSEIIDAKITHFHQDGNFIKFTLNFKAGANYVPNSPTNGRWGDLNIYLDIYPNSGLTLHTHQATDNVEDVGNFSINSSANSGDNNPGSVPAGSTSFKIILARPWTAPVDVGYDYDIVGEYAIPFSGTATSATHIVLREAAGAGGPWTDLTGSTWSNLGVALYGYFKSDKPQYHLQTDCPPQALWIGDINSSWFDGDNWANPNVQISEGGSLPVLGMVPGVCTTVYIPGSGYRGQKLNQTNPIRNFPVLLDGSNPRCKDIIFFQGGQVGRIDLLTYEKAKVQFSLPWDGHSWTNAQPHNFGGAGFYNFAKGYSSPDLSYGSWHMLSIPLRGVTTGDLAYGGYPFTFMRKFNTQNVQADPEDHWDENGGRFTEGDWSTSFTEVIEPFAPAEGLAFYAYSLADASSYGINEYYKDDENPPSMLGQPYGIHKTLGIMELPSYDTQTSLESRRVQQYDGSKSTFHIVDVRSDNFGKFTGTKYDVNRSANNYRFITEAEGDPSEVEYRVSINSNKQILVGNPYMSALDFDAFISTNGGSTSSTTAGFYREYQIWNGSSFDSYVTSSGGSGISTTPGMTKYIPPMQGFFIKTRRASANSTNANLVFMAETMSTVTPSGTTVNLRSTDAETNIIRISTENGDKISRTLIAQRADASIDFVEDEDVTKMFSPSGDFLDVAEVYTYADKTPLSINFINNVSAIIPIGIRVPASGTTTLKLTGMSNYNADKIELVDGISGQTLGDLTGLNEYSYSFNNNNSGYQNNRFFLRISQATTGLGSISAEETIQVYKSKGSIQVLSSSNDKIQQVYVYDLQGRALHADTSVNTDIHQIIGSFGSQVLVVKVITEKNTKSVKLIIN